jgi:hypothetical protein
MADKVDALLDRLERERDERAEVDYQHHLRRRRDLFLARLIRLSDEDSD